MPATVADADAAGLASFVARRADGARSADPRGSGGAQGLGFLTHHVCRLLVGTQSLKRWMPQRAVVAPFGERNFRDEIRLDPVRALRLVAARRIDERRRIPLALDEKRIEVA